MGRNGREGKAGKAGPTSGKEKQEGGEKMENGRDLSLFRCWNGRGRRGEGRGEEGPLSHCDMSGSFYFLEQLASIPSADRRLSLGAGVKRGREFDLTI